MLVRFELGLGVGICVGQVWVLILIPSLLTSL